MMQQQICVIYCTEQQQYLRYVPFVENMTVLQAIEQSGLMTELELPQPLQCGIFGLKVKQADSHILQIGDRVEIYRPLKMNPKDIRRKRAEQHPVGRILKGNQWRKKQNNG